MTESHSTRFSSKVDDLTGRTFGRLTVLHFNGYNQWGTCLWLCRCECGTERNFLGNSLTRPDRPTVSCGCYARENRSALSTKHGMSASPTYGSWAAMIKRCNNPADPAYASYGGAGIEVCDRWQGREGFQNFLADMGERPSLDHSIDRYPDQRGGYGPGNCRWATDQEQAWNRAATRMIEFRGESLPLSEWARRVGVAPTTLAARIDKRGWSLERALTTRAVRGRPGTTTYEFRGESLTLEGWSDRTGVRYTTLYSRVRMGWTVEEVLTTPPWSGNRRRRRH